MLACTMTTRQVMSRDELRSLYAKTQEEERLKQVDHIVVQVYDTAVRQAKVDPETTFIYSLQKGHPLKEFFRTNMSDIVAGLHALFPDSIITQRHSLRTYDIVFDWT